ncbi:MAG TPA: hypothetical protein VF163_12555 [Micromonosporaceae bacterium]
MSNVGPAKMLAAVASNSGAADFVVRWRKALIVVGVIGSTVLLAKKVAGRRKGN